MGMIQATIRKFAEAAFGKSAADLRLLSTESLAVGMVDLEFQELGRAGRLFHGGTQIIANGIAPVQAIPTTTATLALFNGEDPGGKTYYMHRLGFWLGSGTPAAGATLLATVSPAKLATPVTVMTTGYGVGNSSGSTQGTKAKWGTAAALPVGQGGANPAWLDVQSTQQLAVANVGQGDGWVELRGMFAVPPGYALGIAILSGAGTTPLYAIGASWAELKGELE